MHKIIVINTFRCLFLTFTLFLFDGCLDSGHEPVPNEGILIDAVHFGSYPASTLQSLIALSGFEVSPADLKYDVNLYKVAYRTQYKGSEVIASGIVGIPETTVPVSMVSLHHGTIAANSDAPSQQTLISEQSLLYAAFASIGLIVVVPDYLGFGSSAFLLHPYYVEEYSASAVMDNLEAAAELAGTNQVNFNKNLFLTGYSEGGYVTMAVHKYIDQHTPSGFNLVASFPAAGGYDIKKVQEYLFGLDTYSDPYYLAYVAHAYKTTYDWPQPLSDFFNEPYAGSIPALFNGDLTGSQINAQLTTSIETLLPADLLANIDTNLKYRNFVDALHENSLTGWVPVSPMYLYHGDEDVTVPYSNSISVYEQFLSGGASESTVQFIALPGATHSTGLKPYVEDVVMKILELN